jgi:Skp family chaperone for outer membrane proteins
LKRTILFGALCVLATSALAQQQQPPVDPQVAVYRQLLDNANAQLAQSVATMQGQIAQLQRELAAEKAKSAPKDAAKPDGPKVVP